MKAFDVVTGVDAGFDVVTGVDAGFDVMTGVDAGSVVVGTSLHNVWDVLVDEFVSKCKTNYQTINTFLKLCYDNI